MRTIATSCIALSVFALASTASAGGLVWDNNIQTDGGNARALSPPAFPNIRVADDILVPETAWLVSGFRMSGIEDDTWNPGTVMELTIYADDNGLPGEVVTVVEGPFTRTPTGERYFDRDEYLYSITLAEDLLVGEGMQHIGARFPEGGVEGTNYWLTSDGLPDGADTTGSFSLNEGDTWMNSGPGWHHAFEIIGTIPEGAPRDAHGLRHFPDGGAEVTVNESGDLVIFNIGSSGEDGTSIVLGAASEGWSGTLSHGLLPNSASVAANQVGTVSGTPDLPVGGITAVVDGGGAVNIKPSLDGLGASTYTLYLYNGGGDPVYTEENIDPADDKASVGSDEFMSYTLSNSIDASTENITMAVEFGAAVTVSVPVFGDFLADRIEFVPEGGTAGLESVSTLALRLNDTGDVSITAETLRKFILNNAVTGAAKFKAEEAGLVISNISSSGEDGISQALPNVTSLDATLENVALPSSLSRCQMTAYNGTEAEVGTVGVLNVGGLTGVPASYAGVGATQVRVEIYRAGDLQESYVTNNSVLRVALVLPGAEGQPELIGIGQIPIESGPGTYLTFDRVGSIQEPPGGGGASADGDEVRVIANDPGGTIAPLTRIEWDLALLAPVTITSLAYTTGDEPKCTPALDGDVNFDGCTDFDDLLAVLSNWDGDGGSGGDGDCNGSVDFDDLLLVLSGWSEEGECK